MPGELFYILECPGFHRLAFFLRFTNRNSSRFQRRKPSICVSTRAPCTPTKIERIFAVPRAPTTLTVSPGLSFIWFLLSVFVRVELVLPGHCNPHGSKRVQNPNTLLVLGKNLGQSLVAVRRIPSRVSCSRNVIPFSLPTAFESTQ